MSLTKEEQKVGEDVYNMPSINVDGQEWIRKIDHDNILLTALRNKEKEVWEKIEESLPDEYDLTKSLSGTALYSERYGYNVCLTFIKQILQNIKNLSK